VPDPRPLPGASRTPSVRVLPMGDAALLLETDDIEGVLAVVDVLAPLARESEGIWAEVDDLGPAARTVLVVARPTTDLDELARELVGVARRARIGSGSGATDRRVVEIPVTYDGPDLVDVAALTGLAPDEVVVAHTGSTWRVAFGGFAPGFAYLVGGDPRLTVARRPEPRTRVPRGSVALAGQFSGIYPRESPGGWQLIGTTDVAVWEADRQPPALLVPGTTVRFLDASR
jgi:KipI family sensor histidine kinase inhibitor